jgi:hypothetical protein
MLQNELFQREVRAVLGDDFMRPAGSTQRQSTPANTNPNTAAGGAHTGSNAGIMKALADMGSATKRSLSSLAHRFSSSGNPDSHADPRRRGSRTDTSNGREFRPLVESNGEEVGFMR